VTHPSSLPAKSALPILPAAVSLILDRVNTEEEPRQPSHLGWIITQRETPVLDRQGRIQIFGSPAQARQAAQVQGRDIRQCSIAIQPGELPNRGAVTDNITRAILERNAARQKNMVPKPPRIKKTPDPARARNRVRAAARRERERP
jgi:hypothetical protein